MKSRLKSIFLILSIVSTLSSCRLSGLFENKSQLDIELTPLDSSLSVETVSLTGEGPNGERVNSDDAGWDVITFSGLNTGVWRFSAQVRSEDGNLLGFGRTDINVSGSSTTGQLTVDLLSSSSMAVTLDNSPSEIGVGEPFDSHGIVSGGSGDYDYYWFLDGNQIGTGSILGIMSEQVHSGFVLELLAVDSATNESALTTVRYSDITRYIPISVSETHFTIAWSPPETDSDINGYELYYRMHGSNDWTSLSLVDNTTSLEYVVDIFSSPIGPGQWDFGVSSVNDTGNHSPIHASLDTDAIPTQGWYLDWTL